MIGVSGAFIGPGIAYFSRLIAGHEFFSERIARNEVFNHSGNFIAASISAVLVSRLSLQWVFIIVILMAFVAAIAVFRISAAKSFRDRLRSREIKVHSKINNREIIHIMKSAGVISYLLVFFFISVRKRFSSADNGAN